MVDKRRIRGPSKRAKIDYEKQKKKALDAHSNLKMKTKAGGVTNINMPMIHPMLKTGSGILAHGESGMYFTQAFGCFSCPWKATQMCPHGLVGEQRHANGICSQRIQFLQDIASSYKQATGKTLSRQKGIFLVQLTDDKMWADRMYNDLMQKGVDSVWKPDEVLKWRKYITDSISQHVKHEEGSKLTIEKNPLDVIRTIDAEVVEVENSSDR